MKSLNATQLAQILEINASRMVEAREMLNEKDREIGDGDHGTTIARGFASVKEALAGQTFQRFQDVFKTTGMALMRSMGGASGVLYGTLFMAGSKEKTDRFDARALSHWLDLGIEDIEQRGGAKTGDKTMLDALAPASARVRQMTDSNDIGNVLTACADGAREGVEATRSMIARKGRAHTLGEQSLGHEDPGACSVMLILQNLAQACRELETN